MLVEYLAVFPSYLNTGSGLYKRTVSSGLGREWAELHQLKLAFPVHDLHWFAQGRCLSTSSLQP